MMNGHSYVIICGTTKAATTSLFNYLAHHPEVCASSMKETRFFLDADYPVPEAPRYHLEGGLAQYELYFTHCQGTLLRLEATPDYLYSPGTPQKIRKSLSDVKLIFILREPIDRLVSWYRFAKQNGQLPAQVSFEEYVQRKHQNSRDSQLVEQHWHALEQGRYSIYLEAYFDLFERDCLYITRYEAIKRDPLTSLIGICRFVGIDPTFYQDYSFRVFNPTRSMKFAGLHAIWSKVRRRIRMRLHSKPKLHTILRNSYRQFEPFYLAMNTRRDEGVVMSELLRSLLESYYGTEPAALARLLGLEQFSWHASEVLALPVVPDRG